MTARPDATVAPPERGEVHVWVVELEVDDAHATMLQSRLSPSERARAQGWTTDARKRRYLVRQATLHGLARAYAGSCFVMSVSDSHEVAVVALASGGPLGIDVERLDARRPAARIARRFYSSGEQRLLEGIAEPERLEEFYRRWTLREAWAKATGTRLPRTLALFAGDPPRGRWQAVDDLTSGTGPWRARRIDARPGYVATLVRRPRTTRVHVRRWGDVAPAEIEG